MRAYPRTGCPEYCEYIICLRPLNGIVSILSGMQGPAQLKDLVRSPE